MLRNLLAVGALALSTGAFAVDPQAGATARAPDAHSTLKSTSPKWTQLSADQREALAPLAGDWDKFDAARKKKWLEIAARYKDLSPEGQQKMHERMPDLAKLTPEQRKTARENFKKAYALPPDQRRALTQQFQDLPDEKKRELAEQAKMKPAPAPRRAGATTKTPVDGAIPAAGKIEPKQGAGAPAAGPPDAGSMQSPGF